MRQLHTPPPTCEFGELTTEEEQTLAEAEAQRELGISFEEFKRRWENGKYRDDSNPKVTSVAFWLH